jgi:hypothetical protein
MSITKSYFFNEINHLGEPTDLLQQSLHAEQEAKSKKCNKCGRKFISEECGCDNTARVKPRIKLPF